MANSVPHSLENIRHYLEFFLPNVFNSDHSSILSLNYLIILMLKVNCSVQDYCKRTLFLFYFRNLAHLLVRKHIILFVLSTCLIMINRS